jgi:hypothetical protein
VSPTTTLHVDLIGNTRPRSAEWQLNFDISSRFRNAYRRMRFSAKAPQAPNAKSQPLFPPIEESRSPPAFNSTQQEWERTITEGPPQCFFRIEPSGSTPPERLLPPNIPEQKVQSIGHRSFFFQRVEEPSRFQSVDRNGSRGSKNPKPISKPPALGWPAGCGKPNG